MAFSFVTQIRTLLSKYDTKDVFDNLIHELDNHHNQKVHDMTSLKRREKMKIRGDNWEIFCKLYLLKDKQYDRIWLLKEIPIDVRRYLSLSKKDQGIDIVARLANTNPNKHCSMEEYEYVPIQCKFRAPDRHGVTKRVRWNDLATYVGLCCFTGPWNKYIVMTNAPGIRYPHMERGFNKQYKFKIITLAQGTFRSLNRVEWLDIIDIKEENILKEIDKTTIQVSKVPRTTRKTNIKKATPRKKLNIIRRLDSSPIKEKNSKNNNYLNIFF